MNQIIDNVDKLITKYGEDRLNSNAKLLLAYLKEYEGLKFDKNYISTQDFLRMDVGLFQAVIDAKYLLKSMQKK